MNDKTEKKDLPGNLNKKELEQFKKYLEKKLKKKNKSLGDDKDMEWYYDEDTGRFSRQKKKPPSGSVISSSGKVTEGMEVAKGGIVKRYKGGLMVAPKRAKRGY